MNWKSLIAEIQAKGFSQQVIADHVGKSQAWVSSIINGKVSDLKYSDGAALISMLGESDRKEAA